VDLADLVGDAGVEQDALGGGGLAGVDVRHDADVADLGQVGGDVDGHFGSVPLGAWYSGVLLGQVRVVLGQLDNDVRRLLIPLRGGGVAHATGHQR
jgi:hypothetical protein